MIQKLKSLALIGAAAVMAFLINLTPQFTTPTSAASVNGFRPGNIMSDAVMGNYNSMTLADIQNFLITRGNCNNRNYNLYRQLTASYPGITWHWQNGKFVCLAEERFGNGLSVGSGQTAAEIIYQAAQDYRINPQVLLVLLEKEQSLISDSYPNSFNYRTATGYGCPDTAACNTRYYGFKNQVRNAAALFRTVLNGGWSNYPAYRTTYIRYNPKANCGGTYVYVENRATAALYRYTPYQPNSAALNAGTGLGNTCSAYGNRNFYVLFTRWFGSTQTTSNRAPILTSTTKPKPTPLKSVPIDKKTTNRNYVILPKNNPAAVALNANSNGNVNLWTKNQGKNQQWRIAYNARTDDYTITNVATGKVLEVQQGFMVPTARIQVNNNAQFCSQRWKIVSTNDGYYEFIPACSGRYAIYTYANKTTSGTNLALWNLIGSDTQKFIIMYSD